MFEIKSIFLILIVFRFSQQSRRPPSFFANLRATLQVMVTNFNGTNRTIVDDTETLVNIDRLLVLYGCETKELIQQYYQERAIEQDKLTEAPYGKLTVRCLFKGNTLQIDVLSACNLIPMDSNGLSDPFVRIHCIPEERFTNVTMPTTNVQYKTLFPLFDGQFSM